MKEIVKKYCSALLVLWYCVSVIGFDVHTCNGTGRSFLASFVSGMSCTDIHPWHHCGAPDSCCPGHAVDCRHSCCCCAEAVASCRETDDLVIASHCCSDHYQVLAVTGMQQEDAHRHYDECHCGHCPCLADSYVSLPEAVARPCRLVRPVSGFGELFRPDILTSYGVWRI